MPKIFISAEEREAAYKAAAERKATQKDRQIIILFTYSEMDKALVVKDIYKKNKKEFLEKAKKAIIEIAKEML